MSMLFFPITSASLKDRNTRRLGQVIAKRTETSSVYEEDVHWVVSVKGSAVLAGQGNCPSSQKFGTTGNFPLSANLPGTHACVQTQSAIFNDFKYTLQEIPSSWKDMRLLGNHLQLIDKKVDSL